MSRAKLSKKTRFEVFKRDGFVCQYCGSHPPSAVLELDHVIPVSRGGGNEIDNLITACFDCNRGKSNNMLDAVPDSITQRAEALKEKRDQLAAYERLLKSIRRQEEKKIDSVEAVFHHHYPALHFTDSFRKSVRRFIQMMPLDAIKDAMDSACRRIGKPEDAVKYFCGICWRTIKEDGNA